MAKCEQCGQELAIVAGKVKRRFCSDKCRKAAKRAKAKEINAPGCPRTDELRTTNTKLTSDINSGQATSDTIPEGVTQGVTDGHCSGQVSTDTIPEQLSEEGLIEDVVKAKGVPIHDVPTIPRRGVGIKSFRDLPDDVQRTIESMSIDKEDKTRRTARAIHYQHLFPNRYASTGLN